MRVGINALFLIPGEVGGSETYLCETLLAVTHRHPDIALAFITNRENDGFLRTMFGSVPACSFHRLGVRASNRYLRILAEQFCLPGMIRRIRPDLLWSPGYTMPYHASCPQVVSLLDMQYRSHPEDMTTLARWTTHALVLLAARRADRVLTISRFSKQEIMRATGYPGERIQVTPLGVDPAFGQEESSRPRQITAPYILCVANSYPHKNLHSLAAAFRQIAGSIPHHLVLVGKPRLGEPALLQELETIPAERIHRLSGLSRPDLIRLYHDAALFVFPSLYEGFGLPVLEAMAAGTPVVTTREGSIPEVGGDDVIYANGRNPSELAGRILEVLGWSESERQQHIRSARIQAGRFHWDFTADATVAAWKEVDDSGRRERITSGKSLNRPPLSSPVPVYRRP
jgi:glycosyltransferase involved in cell wall biosynthesis